MNDLSNKTIEPDKDPIPGGARSRPLGVTSGSVRRSIQHHDGAVVTFDLGRYVEDLRADPGWRLGAPNSVTILKEPGLRLVVIALRAGTSIKEHVAPGRITIQTIAGHTRVGLAETEIDLPRGHLVTLEPARAHDVYAVEESAILLTIVWPNSEAT